VQYLLIKEARVSHNLFGDRFGDARKPAWHHLGRVFEKAMSASQALKKIGGYNVRLAEAYAEDIPLNKMAILRDPTTDDPEVRVFGIVGNDYTLITPQDVCSIYDEQVGKPVETIGALGKGEIFFLSTYLPTLDVKGDEVENYLLMSNPMTGLLSAELRVTPVRVVCQNTLIASEQLATQKLRIVHDKNAKLRLAEWLRETYEFAATSSRVLRDLFVEMTAVRVKDAEARKMFAACYPHPTKTRLDATKAVMDQRLKWWEEGVQLADRRRDGAKMLFEGMGTGMDTKAAKGTLWGAYNAVVETEDYRRGRDDGQISASAMGWSTIPERYMIKKRAFEYAVDLVQ
jgi:phage/plasmid-like protein (TIGR03299 family)